MRLIARRGSWGRLLCGCCCCLLVITTAAPASATSASASTVSQPNRSLRPPPKAESSLLPPAQGYATGRGDGDGGGDRRNDVGEATAALAPSSLRAGGHQQAHPQEDQMQEEEGSSLSPGGRLTGSTSSSSLSPAAISSSNTNSKNIYDENEEEEEAQVARLGGGGRETVGLVERIRRSLSAGANCVMAGGGSVVPFEACLGCSMKEAYQCIENMRGNVSGTVPKGCSITDLDLHGKPKCCPRFQNARKPWTIIRTSAAYPDAFTCLVKVGCQGSVAWTSLKNECRMNKCNSIYACSELQSPARRGAVVSGGLVASLALLLTSYFLTTTF